MFKRIRNLVLTLATASVLLVPAMASANLIGNICQGVDQPTSSTGSISLSGSDSGGCATDTGTGGGSLTSILRLVINVLSIIVGFVAVIMIVVAGFRYITSGGESGKVSGAKNAIVYAVIGLVIVALAQVIVHFVLAKAVSVGQ